MIEIAEETRIGQLKEIWHKSYDDPEEYIKFFMENAFKLSIPVVCVKDDTAAGVIYIFPCEVGNTGQKAYYWYAGGVLPQYRKQGVFNEIVEYIIRLAWEQGAVSFLYSMPELMEFYKKSGLKRKYYSSDIYLKSEKTNIKCNIKRSGLTAQKYLELRDAAFKDKNYIRWDEAYLEYVILEKKYCNGFCDLLEADGEEYALSGEIRDGSLYIEETTMSYDRLLSLQDELAALYGVTVINAHMPLLSDGKEQNSKKIYSGIGNADTGKLWVSLTLL